MPACFVFISIRVPERGWLRLTGKVGSKRILNADTHNIRIANADGQGEGVGTNTQAKVSNSSVFNFVESTSSYPRGGAV
jgi:hypothetical protein